MDHDVSVDDLQYGQIINLDTVNNNNNTDDTALQIIPVHRSSSRQNKKRARDEAEEVDDDDSPMTKKGNFLFFIFIFVFLIQLFYLFRSWKGFNKTFVKNRKISKTGGVQSNSSALPGKNVSNNIQGRA